MSTVKDVARMLATEHKADDDELNAVYWAPHPEEVRLIEVTGSCSVLPTGSDAVNWSGPPVTGWTTSKRLRDGGADRVGGRVSPTGHA